MLGVVWGAEQAGLGDATPLEELAVRGTTGQVAAMSSAGQVVPDLGTVVAWDEQGMPMALLGRGWDRTRAPELAALAGALQPDGKGGWTLPPEARPDMPVVAYQGSPEVLTTTEAPTAASFDVQYRDGDDGLLDVYGAVASPEAYEAFRFLAPDVRRAAIGEHDAFVGQAAGIDGLSIVTWREPDGLVVRVVGSGDVDLDATTAAARAAQEIDPPQWADLVEATVGCERQAEQAS
jgi:hypothetical protein